MSTERRSSAIPFFSVAPPSAVSPTNSSTTGSPRSRRKSLFAATDPSPRWDEFKKKSITEDSVWHNKQQSTREIFLDFLTRNGLDRILDWTQAIFSLVAVVIYVVQTYIENLWLETWVLVLEIFIGSFFLFDYSLGLFLARKRCGYIFSIESLVDFVTIVPLFIDLVIFFSDHQREAFTVTTLVGLNETSTASGHHAMAPSPSSLPIVLDGVTRSGGLTPYNFAVFRVTRVLRALRVLRAWKAVKFGTLGISVEAFKTIFTLVVLVFCGSGIFIALEYQQGIKFHEAIYFMFITLTTIGYGDYRPKTPEGQIFVVIFMSCTFVVIPKQIAKLRLHSRKNRLAHVYENPLIASGHLLLCGHITPSAIIDFVHELYDTSHGRQPLPLCVLTPQKLSKKLKMLLNSRFVGGQVDTIIGSYHSNFDLERCRAQEAQACFIIADKSKRNPDVEDANVILGGLAFRNLNNQASLFLSVIQAESMERAKWVIGDSGGALSVSFLRQQTLAANIVCPGASTLLSNLLRSETLHLTPTVVVDEQGVVGSRPVMMKKSRSMRSTIGSSSGGGIGGGIGSGDSGNSSEEDGDRSDSSISSTSSFFSNGSAGARAADNIDLWSYEYQWGMCHEMYPLDFTECFHGLRFSWIVKVLYHQYGCILFGVLHGGHITLNPIDYIVQERDVGFVIATQAEKVQEMIDTFDRAELFQRHTRDSGATEEGSGTDGDGVPGSDTFPAGRGTIGSLRSTTGGGRKDLKRNESRNHVFVANGGRVLLSRAREQRTIEGSKKKRRDNLKANSGSVELPRRPMIRKGSTVSDIFGPLKLSKTNGHSITTNTPSSTRQVEEKKNEERKSKETDDRLHGIDEDNRIPMSPYSTNRSVRQAIAVSVGSNDPRTSRLITTMQKDKRLEMSRKPRTKDDVVLEDCRGSSGSHGRSSGGGRDVFYGHIIACGAPKHLIYFLSRLRSKNLKRMRKIVVLHHDMEQWDLLSAFPKTYLVNGNPMSFIDLDRCNVADAYHVVFFGEEASSLASSREQDMDGNIQTIVEHAQNGQPVPLFRGGDSAALEDFQSIMGLTCMNVNPVLTLHTCHLRHTSSVRYLRPRMSNKALQSTRNASGLAEEYRRLFRHEPYFLSPSFASGRVFADAMLDRLISQAYFNPLVIPLFHALVASSVEYSFDQEMTKQSEQSEQSEQSGGISSGHLHPTSKKSQAGSPERLSRSPSRRGLRCTNESDGVNMNESYEASGPLPTQSFLIHVEVPVRMIGKPFRVVFDNVMEKKGYIPLALYRAPGVRKDEERRGTEYSKNNGNDAAGNGKSNSRQKIATLKEQQKSVLEGGGRRAASHVLFESQPTSRSRISSFRHSRTPSSTHRRMRNRRNAKSFGEVVNTNPLPYVYTCPIPDAIVCKNDTIICLTSDKIKIDLQEKIDASPFSRSMQRKVSYEEL